MAYISLVHKKSGTVQQIQDSNAPTFETHEDFEWVNGPYDKLDDDGLQAPDFIWDTQTQHCLLYTSPSPRDKRQSRMPSSA